MALTGLQLHHHAVRMRPDAAAETLTFYRDVLGLTPDEGAREVHGIPLFWMTQRFGIVGCHHGILIGKTDR